MDKAKKQSLSLAEIYSKFGVFLILLVAIIAGTILSRNFLVPSNLMSVAQNVSCYAIIAIGMTRLLIGGGVDLSAGSNLAFCSVIVAVVYQNTGSTLLAIIASLVCGTLIGAVNGFFASYIGLMPFIVTLATQMTVRGLAYLVAGGAPVFGVGDGVVFLGNGNIGGFPMIFLVVIICTVIMQFVMTRTSHGRYLYAIGGNAEAAGAAGINVKRQLFLNYAIMGLIVGIAAVLYAGRTNSGLPAGGVNFEFEAIIGSVLGGTSMAGGVGNVVCSIVGVFIVGIINNLMNLCSVNAFWQQVVKGIVILVAVLLDIFTRNSIMKSTKKR
ncbi:MAG: ABC transporter permease [Eubacteriales bacterium]|nr:ABC transporter permease [Eubacteriales bacterium]